METNDPDDVLTLAILATHPQVDLLSVTVVPGSPEQVGLVRHILWTLLGSRDRIPVGARSPGHPKRAVSEFHDHWIGPWKKSDPDGEGCDILLDAVAKRPDAILVTGGPLTNAGRALAAASARDLPFFRSWTCQGGFAGDSVVPPGLRLPKFSGLETCPTFNLNGDPKAALALAASPLVARKSFVSKNVCHGILWDLAMHLRMTLRRPFHPGLELAYQGMDLYLKKKPDGKALHDPLAACCAIDPSICSWEDVELYREKGEWGTRLLPGSSQRVSVSADRVLFERVLVGIP